MSCIKISWINFYLNALDERGQPIYDEEKKTLLDRVEFHESDILSYCKDHDIQLERIVECIPQVLPLVLYLMKLVHTMSFRNVNFPRIMPLFVFLQILNPNPDAMSKIITENVS